MTRKCLIIYASRTGNTEKVALRFKNTFERNGWECDIFKISQETDVSNLPFEYKNYDFICVGSPVHHSLPPEEIINAVRKQPKEVGKRKIRHRKIVPGPKKGIVFATYAGAHLGPKEAEPTLKVLELEMEHQRFKCIGSFCCPGKFVNDATPGGYYGDIRNRPSERDLLKAEIFMEEKIEELH